MLTVSPSLTTLPPVTALNTANRPGKVRSGFHSPWPSRQTSESAWMSPTRHFSRTASRLAGPKGVPAMPTYQPSCGMSGAAGWGVIAARAKAPATPPGAGLALLGDAGAGCAPGGRSAPARGATAAGRGLAAAGRGLAAAGDGVLALVEDFAAATATRSGIVMIAVLSSSISPDSWFQSGWGAAACGAGAGTIGRGAGTARGMVGLGMLELASGRGAPAGAVGGRRPSEAATSGGMIAIDPCIVAEASGQGAALVSSTIVLALTWMSKPQRRHFIRTVLPVTLSSPI